MVDKDRELQIAATLVGDMNGDPAAQIKYGFLFEALAEQLSVVTIYNSKLSKWNRIRNGLWTMHPNRTLWRERFYKNIFAFKQRSKQVASWVEKEERALDILFQVGVTFDAAAYQKKVPNFIYTDYTAALSARNRDGGRSPFGEKELTNWLTLEQRAYETAVHIATRSEFVRKSIIQDYSIPHEKVTVVGGGVNFAQLPAKREARDWEAPTILFIGKEFFRKGGDILLDGFALMRREIPEAKLIMVTAGPLPNNRLLENVQIVEPVWDRAVIQQLYEQADIFVLPSRLETWGDVLLEAMAYSLPCIGVYGEAMEEIVIPEETGLLIAPEDPESLAAALIHLSDRSRAELWGRQGRARIDAAFRWAHCAEKLAVLLREAVVNVRC